MSGALTYGDFELSFSNIVSMEELEIEEGADAHGRMRLTAVVDADQELDIFRGLPKTVTLYYKTGRSRSPLFAGIVMQSYMKRSGSHIQLELEAGGMTYLLDITRKIRTFQNLEETSHQIIDAVMADYQGSFYKKNIAAKPVGQFLFQYEETDWEFLKRLASQYHGRIYPDALSGQISFQAGLPPAAPVWQAEQNFYVSRCGFGAYEAYRENADDAALPQQYIRYEIESVQILPLGACVTWRKGDWYISAVKRKLRAGLLVNTYELSRKEADRCLRCFNGLLPGISLDAVVADVKRDQVQVTIKNDLNTAGSGRYWFPYSTVSGSADGSGWYCMPERGEAVRVYFPTGDEREAYVISNAAGKTGGGKGNMDPAVRHISTAQGNVVSLSEGGADISVKDGAAGISLGASGEITITATDSISLFAGGKVCMDADSIVIDSEIQADLASDAGAGLTVTASRIEAAAVKIYEN